MLRSSLIVICSLLLASCGEKDTYDPARDYFTFANTEQFVTRHIALDLDVDFVIRTLFAVSEFISHVGTNGNISSMSFHLKTNIADSFNNLLKPFLADR